MVSAMRLLVKIREAGLEDLAKTSTAYQTLMRIVNTGEDVKNWWPDGEMKKCFNEDATETARVLSNPTNWGISDERWREFCKEYQ